MSVVSSASLLALTALTGAVALGDRPVAEMDCVIMNDNIDSRLSPLDSVSFEVQGHAVKVCYGRPSAKGRTMIGGEAVPYGNIWRTGANEPTMIHTSTALNFGEIEIEAGTYSFYTVPGEDKWEVILNRSITQWGRENRYTEEVRAQEVGRGTVESERMDSHVETFTMRAVSSGADVMLLLEWEHTRVMVPIKPAG